jgi:hypothetical protein
MVDWGCMKKLLLLLLFIPLTLSGLTDAETRFLKTYVPIEHFSQWYKVSKFGHNDGVTTTLEPLCLTGVYKTPTSGVALEILSSSANDDAVGTGARTVSVQGLGSDWTLLEEIVTMDGTTPVDLVNTFTRVFSLMVLTTGTYATQTQGSHAGTITLREDGGGDTWAQITLQEGFPTSTSQIGVYTVPDGWKAWLLNKKVSIDANQAVNLYLFVREKADENPGGPMVLLEQDDSLIEPFERDYMIPQGPFEGPCDIGFMADTAAGTGNVSVDFELIVFKD